MLCSSCTYKDFSPAFEIDGYSILKCRLCKHMVTDQQQIIKAENEIYSDEYFFGGKDGYPDYTSMESYLVKQGKYYARKIGKYMSTGSVLDVGAAAGFILKGFISSGWKGVGLEPNQTMVNYGKEKLNLTMHKGTLEDFTTEEHFNLIILIQVMAHVTDIEQSFNQINKLLEPDGMLLVETWNRDSFTARLFGKKWHEYSPPSTIHYFSKKTLDHFMSIYGFQRVAQGRPRKFIYGSHARALINYKLKKVRATRWMVGLERLIPARLLIPYPAEDLFWSVYRKIK